MKQRTIAFYKPADIRKKYPICMPLGLMDTLAVAYEVIFPGAVKQNPMLMELSSEQQAIVQELADVALHLIQDTDILPGSPRQTLQTLTVSDIPQILRLAIITVLSEHDSTLVDKYKRMIPRTKLMRDSKTNKTRKKAARTVQNVIYQAPPQPILTQRRRWFAGKYKGYPEQLYAAMAFYVLSDMMHGRLSCENLGFYIRTITNLVGMATRNTSQKRAAEASIESRS